MKFDPTAVAFFHYPIIPWIGLMALGYLFGTLYKKDFDVALQGKWLLGLGLGTLTVFFILRGWSSYGDLVPLAGTRDHDRNPIFFL